MIYQVSDGFPGIPALYVTSFHLPINCKIEGVEHFLKDHANLMPGTLPTGPIIKFGKSHLSQHRHVMVHYVFENLEQAKEYINNTELNKPAREAFSKKYGDVAQERKRYINGEEITAQQAVKA